MRTNNLYKFNGIIYNDGILPEDIDGCVGFIPVFDMDLTALSFSERQGGDISLIRIQDRQNMV